MTPEVLIIILFALFVGAFALVARGVRRARAALTQRLHMVDQYFAYLAVTTKTPAQLTTAEDILRWHHETQQLITGRFGSQSGYWMYAGSPDSRSTEFVRDYRADMDEARQQLLATFTKA